MPRRLHCSILVLLATAGLGLATLACANEPAVIGNATQLKPEAGAKLDGKARALAVGADLHRNEQVWTARGARLDIAFLDGSSVTLGENARIVLDAFVLPEGGGAGNQVLRCLAGALRFIGGAVDKSGATKIVTPMATVTVRGTEFFAGPDRRGLWRLRLSRRGRCRDQRRLGHAERRRGHDPHQEQRRADAAETLARPQDRPRGEAGRVLIPRPGRGLRRAAASFMLRGLDSLEARCPPFPSPIRSRS